jgi:hypothetical protein
VRLRDEAVSLSEPEANPQDRIGHREAIARGAITVGDGALPLGRAMTLCGRKSLVVARYVLPLCAGFSGSLYFSSISRRRFRPETAPAAKLT